MVRHPERMIPSSVKTRLTGLVSPRTSGVSRTVSSVCRTDRRIFGRVSPIGFYPWFGREEAQMCHARSDVSDWHSLDGVLILFGYEVDYWGLFE